MKKSKKNILKEMLIIRHKLLLLTMTIFLILPGLSLSAERLVIIGFHQRPGYSERALIQKAKGRVRRSYRLINAMSVCLSEKEIERLKKNKEVAYVEEDGIVMAVEPLPGDEYTNAWGVGHIGADVTHAGGNKGAGIKIAIIDSGIDYTHEDLDDNYAGGYDFVFDDDDPFDDNSISHGTHVAGIIAAEENGIGVIGVAPEADIYAVKVLDGAGFGLASWVIAGIEWAVENGMDIVNLSMEGQDLKSLQAACDSAYDAGVLLVAAGGNSIAGGGLVTYPAAYESVIAVTGTDVDDVQVYFSPSGPELELAAPGVDILSTVTVANGSYSSLSGTSQAAPHVAGTAALLFSIVQDENGDGMLNDEVRKMLQMTAIDLGEAGLDDIYGFGLVNAELTNACLVKEIYGEDSEETELLRYFRDDVLSKSTEGREIIKMYYKWSPTIVKIMKEDEEFKKELKEIMDSLLPLIRVKE